MQSILIHACDDPGLDARLRIAVDMARSFDAHLTFLQAVAHQVVLPGDFYGTVAAQMQPVAQNQADELRGVVEARLRRQDVRWTWRQVIGLIDTQLITHAALNDLVMVGAVEPFGSEKSPSRLAGSLAIHAGTPILITPRRSDGFDPEKTVLVGWNGSPQASRAVKAALPFLRKAKKVVLANVTGEPEARLLDLPAADAAEFLSRHGVRAEIVELPAERRHPAEVLQQAAATRDAGLIALGAYGHSRLYETVFGGVTRRMMTDPDIPLLLAH